MQPSETSELVEKLEDSQMVLGSMASNRYSTPFRDRVTAWLGRLGIVSEQVHFRPHLKQIVHIIDWLCCSINI